MNRVATACYARRAQNLLLNIWCQHEQIHDLGDSGAGDIAQFFPFGVVGHLGVADQVTKPEDKLHCTKCTVTRIPGSLRVLASSAQEAR